MRIFTSLIELKNFVPETEQDQIVAYKYYHKKLKIYCWYGYWVEKIYWTLKEAANYMGEREKDVAEMAFKKFPSIRKRYTHYNAIRLTFHMLAPVKHMIEQTKSVHV